LRDRLAGAVTNKGVALVSLNELSAAIIWYDEAIAIRRTLIEEGRTELRNELAMALANKGQALAAQSDDPSAFAHLSEAVALVEECVHRDGQTPFRWLLDRVPGWRDEVKKAVENG